LKGIKVESEHSDVRCIQEQIAKAHLSENKNYYKSVTGKGKEQLITIK
jgi:hypothetical protein